MTKEHYHSAIVTVSVSSLIIAIISFGMILGHIISEEKQMKNELCKEYNYDYYKVDHYLPTGEGCCKDYEDGILCTGYPPLEKEPSYLDKMNGR